MALDFSRDQWILFCTPGQMKELQLYLSYILSKSLQILVLGTVLNPPRPSCYGDRLGLYRKYRVLTSDKGELRQKGEREKVQDEEKENKEQSTHPSFPLRRRMADLLWLAAQYFVQF